MDAGCMERMKARTISLLEDRRVFAVLMIVASLLILHYTAVNSKWGDLDHYYDNAGDVLSGLMPYSEAAFEYPPLSLVFMLIPRLLSWDLASFHYACAFLTYAFLAAGAWVLLRMSDDLIGSRWRTHLVLICLVIFSSYFLIARNDVYPTVLAIVAMRLFQKDRAPLAAAVLAVAAMTKLYPAILILPMLAVLLSRRDWRGIGCALAAAGAVVLLVELPFLLTDPSTAFAYLTYHSDRGIQVESVAAGAFMLWDKLFPGDLDVVFSYGSDNLTGSGPDGLAPFMNPLLGVALAVFIVAIAVRTSHGYGDRDRETALFGAVCVAMVMLFVGFSKVYSAQYVIWILMLLPFTQARCFESTSRDMILLLMIPFGVFTHFSYMMYSIYGIFDMSDIVVAMIFMKNVFHIVLTAWIVRMCWMEASPGCSGDSVHSADLASIRYGGVRYERKRILARFGPGAPSHRVHGSDSGISYGRWDPGLDRVPGSVGLEPSIVPCHGALGAGGCSLLRDDYGLLHGPEARPRIQDNPPGGRGVVLFGRDIGRHGVGGHRRVGLEHLSGHRTADTVP